jgi:transcriptional regulator with XRE-family HTH domain
MPLSPCRFARLNADLTILDLEKRSGVSASRLSVIERHLVPPTPDEIARIAKALKKPAAELFPAATDPKSEAQTPDQGAA